MILVQPVYPAQKVFPQCLSRTEPTNKMVFPWYAPPQGIVCVKAAPKPCYILTTLGQRVNLISHILSQESTWVLVNEIAILGIMCAMVGLVYFFFVVSPRFI